MIWTALYADIAVSSARVLDGRRNRRPGAPDDFAARLGVNLALNEAWSWVFFRFRRLGLAPVVAGALTVSGADLARRARTVDPPAAVGFSAYTAWCAFTTVLSATLWRRNRDA